jgi:ribonucleoside-diphosphate reductase alpha chain
MEVPYEWHIKHQARWQKWIHNAASKTINMPESASVEDVREAYMMAWEMGCKGITVYRDGSKDKQVLRAVEHVSPGVGHERFGSTLDFTTGCGSIHVTCNELERRPYEVYVLSEGGCPANNEALGKVISKYLHDPRLRGGELETVQRITRTLHKVRCMTALRSKKAAGKSCADIIASRMDKVWADENIEVVKPTCPECGRELRFGGGCGSGECVCGWSGCS